MNNLHCYLDLPFEIKKPDICNTVPKGLYHQDFFRREYEDTNVKALLNSVGLDVRHLEVFYTAPNTRIPIHTDTPVYNNRTKLNVTWGPEEGVIQWWKAKEAKVKYERPGASPLRTHKNIRADLEDCELIIERNTNKPSLVNVGQLHGTYNPHPTQGRWTLCFIICIPGQPFCEWDYVYERMVPWIVK